MTFSMLPDRLSTDLSSLNENVKRLAMVTEMLVGVDGAILESSVYPAVVQNHAQLTYNAAWLEGKKDLREPAASDITARVLEKIVHNDELAYQLKLQNEAAERLRERRHLAGALSLETSGGKKLMAQSKILKSATQSRFSCVRLTLTGASLIADRRRFCTGEPFFPPLCNFAQTLSRLSAIVSASLWHLSGLKNLRFEEWTQRNLKTSGGDCRASTRT